MGTITKLPLSTEALKRVAMQQSWCRATVIAKQYIELKRFMDKYPDTPIPLKVERNERP